MSSVYIAIATTRLNTVHKRHQAGSSKYSMPAGQESEATEPGLGGKLELMHIIERLKTQTRTGWVNVKVPGRVESIADHMYRMAMLSLLSEEDEELDIAKCVHMAIVHDLAEALVGDITPHDGISKAQKQKLEEVRFGVCSHVHSIESC